MGDRPDPRYRDVAYRHLSYRSSFYPGLGLTILKHRSVRGLRVRTLLILRRDYSSICATVLQGQPRSRYCVFLIN